MVNNTGSQLAQCATKMGEMVTWVRDKWVNQCRPNNSARLRSRLTAPRLQTRGTDLLEAEVRGGGGGRTVGGDFDLRGELADVDVEAVLDLVEDLGVVLVGHERDRQPLRAEPPRPGHLQPSPQLRRRWRRGGGGRVTRWR